MNTFSALKQSISAWMGQDDLTTYLADFIEIATARVNQRLRIKAMEQTTTSTLTAGSASISLPTRFIGLRGAYLDGDHRLPLQFLAPEQLSATSDTSTFPKFFTIRGDSMVFQAPADANYNIFLHYYQAFQNLSNSNTSNWLTQNAPQVLLYGSLQAAAEFVHDDEAVAKWGALFERELESLKQSDQDTKYGPRPVMRTVGSRP